MTAAEEPHQARSDLANVADAAEPAAPAGSRSRSVVLVAHPGRQDAVAAAEQAARLLLAAGLEVRVLPDLAPAAIAGVQECNERDAAAGAELVVVLGGDGTILRSAEIARPWHTPLLGVNLGHVGFLAESEADALPDALARAVAGDYVVEKRMTLDVLVQEDETVVAQEWAVNEASVEKSHPHLMLDLIAEIDGRPLSRWGADGVVVATPTGSTAYAFSAGGPVVWPEVQAMLVVPVSAHALFARPLVVSPESVVALEVPAGTREGVLWCDGRRTHPLPPRARVEVRRSPDPLRLARLHTSPFTDRLVAKFDLPVEGWRGRRRRRKDAGP
jgi:NAD+ kinase